MDTGMQRRVGDKTRWETVRVCEKKNETEGKEGASETTEEVRSARGIFSDKKGKTERES